jgi:hypothetical protein
LGASDESRFLNKEEFAQVVRNTPLVAIDRVWGGGVGTHYVVLAHKLSLDHRPPIVNGQQHSGFRWLSAAELSSLPDVHQNTRAYFL